MAAILIKDKVNVKILKEAEEDYGEYLKVVVDVSTGEMVVGGQWHADGEKILIERGCKQDNIWGGGIDLVTKQIDYDAVINIRPTINPSHVILDGRIRKTFEEIVKRKFGYE